MMDCVEQTLQLNGTKFFVAENLREAMILKMLIKNDD